MFRKCLILFLAIFMTLILLACGDASPTPPGKIAFVTARDMNDEIYIMDADGSNKQRLTNNPASDRLPAWSPDGTHIAFMSIEKAVKG